MHGTIFLSGVLAVGTAIGALAKGLVWPGVAGFVGPLLCLMAGAVIRGTFHVGTPHQRLAGRAAGITAIAIGMGLLMSTGYVVRLFNIELAGATWELVGAL